MNINRQYQAIVKLIAAYQQKLAHWDEEKFNLTPPIGGWSYSEVYSHIFDSSLLSLMATQNAAKGDGENQPTHFAVKLILFFGSLPPGKKYKVPERLKDRVKKISKATAQHLIDDTELQLTKVLPALKNPNPSSKIKHPRLGYLNAKQWMRFIEVHLHHHLKQINRIENSFREAH